MGWWGVTAMSGDAPSDAMWKFKSIIGLRASFWDRFERITTSKKAREEIAKVRAAINSHLGQCIAWCETQQNDEYYDDYCIAYQVLSIFIMNHGADFPDWLRGQCIECCVNDTWGQEDERRLNAMLSLINDVLDYEDGEIKIESEPDQGLLGALFTSLDKAARGEEIGLINDGPKKRSIQ